MTDKELTKRLACIWYALDVEANPVADKLHDLIFEVRVKLKEEIKEKPSKKVPDNLDGMKFCLELIQALRLKYYGLGYTELEFERVLHDIENEIGVRAYQDWGMK